MISTKRHTHILAALMKEHGITDVIISPGSRNGPLIHTFTGCGLFSCRSVVDERSAAYFALGVAQSQRKPVAVVCSSGTAALNFAPAVAEAFYQNIPLVVLTADRPPHMIDKGENQTIRQHNIYQNFCKKWISLSTEEDESQLLHSSQMIDQLLTCATTGLPGPVHINIPFEEPLHEVTEETIPVIKKKSVAPQNSEPKKNRMKKLIEKFNRAERVMILPGQQYPNSTLIEALTELTNNRGCVILSESVANVNNPLFIENPDLVITAILKDHPEQYRPQLVITFGRHRISRLTNQFLNRYRPEEHWHISKVAQYYDTFQSLTEVIEADASDFFQILSKETTIKKDVFYQIWKKLEIESKTIRDRFIEDAGFCDLTVIDKVIKALPDESVLHLGNSSPVRYAQLLNSRIDIEYFSNRGVSGIDGSLSTAVGHSASSEKMHTIIIGDLSLFYDSNALWNNYLGGNLRIVVIHNGGGNIFSLIDGPKQSPAYSEFFFTPNKYSAKGLARTFGLKYYQAGDERSLKEELIKFFSDRGDSAAILEIFTDETYNTKEYHNLFNKIKERQHDR